MKQSTVILTSLEKIELLTNLPISYHSILSYTIKASGDNIPLNIEKIQTLFQKNQRIILYKVAHPNDHLLQGVTTHITESMILFFIKCAKEFKATLYLLTDHQLLKIDQDSGPRKIFKEVFVNKQHYTQNTVTSIQKMDTNVNKGAFFWVELYFHWLEKFTFRLIHVKKMNDTYSFCLRGLKNPLLVLQKNDRLEDQEIVELIILGGFLNKERKKKDPYGRFFFIRSAESNLLYTSLVHFKPTLPWPIYRMSQGPIHRLVMFSFKRYVKKYVETAVSKIK